MIVSPNDRFSRRNPCPICGGFDGKRRGKGERCYGFLSPDRTHAHCTREELAGSIWINPDSGAYAHRLDGPCLCGRTHSRPQVPPARSPERKRALGAGAFAKCPHPYPCDYTDDRGNVLYRVARWQQGTGKRYSIHHPSTDGWCSGRGGATRVPYGLQEVRAAVNRGEMLHVVEGEKKVHLLRELGLTATCSDGGAGKFTIEIAAWFQGVLGVVVWTDEDVPGRKHADSVSRLLHEAGVPRIIRPRPPGLSEGEGLDDWLAELKAEHNSDVAVRAEIDGLVERAQLWRPESSLDLEEDVRAVVTRASEVSPLPVDWLWASRVPLGMLTGIVGDPGVGKSTLVSDLAARISRGDRMLDGSDGPGAGSVVILSAEEDFARVTRPKLEALGADLSRIVKVEIPDGDNGPRQPVLNAFDFAVVEDVVRRERARLVIVDPVMGFLPSDVNAHKDQDVRRALSVLMKLAERTGAAVVIVQHPNKNAEAQALYRAGGSIAFVAAARSVLLLARDPRDADGESRVFAPVKSNLSPTVPSLSLRLVSAPGTTWPVIRCMGTCTLSANDLLASPVRSEARGKLDDARDFLHEALRGAGEVPADELFQQARSAGISRATLKRAKSQCPIETSKHGRPGAEHQNWTWRWVEPRSKELSSSPDSPIAVEPESLRPSHTDKPLCEGLLAEGARPPGPEHLPVNVRLAHPEQPCTLCSGSSYWLARSGGGWICDACHPAPTEGMVENRMTVGSPRSA